MAYFEADMFVTNVCTRPINQLTKDKNREERGYSLEIASSAYSRPSLPLIPDETCHPSRLPESP